VVEGDHSVRKTVQLQIALGCCLVVEQQNCAHPSGEELFDCKNLPPEPQWLSGEKPHLRQRIENDTLRRVIGDGLENGVHGLLKLDLGRMENRVSFLDFSQTERGQLEDIYTVETPAV